MIILLGGGFKYFLISALFGEDEPILTVRIFLRWVETQPPTSLDFGHFEATFDPQCILH